MMQYDLTTNHIASQTHNIPSSCVASLHSRWNLITGEHVTWHRMTPHKKSHHIKWRDMTPHHVTWHDHLNSRDLTTNQLLTTLLHLTMQPTTWHHVPHHRTLHHHHRHTTETQPATTKTLPPDGTAEGWCTQKTRFGHRTGWSPCAHSTGKFFPWFKVFPAETSARGSSGNYLYVFDSFDQYSLYSLILSDFWIDMFYRPDDYHSLLFYIVIASSSTTASYCYLLLLIVLLRLLLQL